MLKTSLKRQRSTTSPPIVKAKISRLKKEDYDFCSDIAVIPQFSETCWFNAILMATFYSQQSRLLIKFTSTSWTPETITDIKKYKLLMIFKSIVFKYYKDQREAIEFYKKIKPEIILLYLLRLNKTKKELQKLLIRIKEKLFFGWNDDYIIDFYKFLGIKCLDIITVEKSFYYHLKGDIKKSIVKKDPQIKIKAIIDANPDVICIIKNKAFENYINKNKALYNPYLSTNYTYKTDFDINDIKTEITFNGYTYTLDSCLLSNHNREVGGHSVAGITCGNTRYVYNGWNVNTIDKGIDAPIIETKSNPCALFKYDWISKTTGEFCFNTNECKLSSEIKPRDLCFSFAKGNKLYVYVKTVSTSSQHSSKITTKNNFSTPSDKISSAIKSVYSVDKLDTKEKLLLQLEKIYNLNRSGNVNLKINIKYLKLDELSFDELKEIYMNYVKNRYKKRITKLDKMKYELVIKIINDLIVKYIELYEIDDETKEELLSAVSNIKDEIAIIDNTTIYEFLDMIKSDLIEEFQNESDETKLKEKMAFIKKINEKLIIIKN